MRLPVDIHQDEMREVGMMVEQHPMLLLQSPVCCAKLAEVRLGKVDPAAGDVLAYNKDIEDTSQAHAIQHNASAIFQDTSTGRIFRLFVPLLASNKVFASLNALKVLNVGARTEAEVFLLLGLGFAPENLHCVDLLSYSDWIKPADAHDLEYEDNTFDITTAAWVFAYSKQNQRLADELVRVTKPGGYIAIGCVAEPMSLAEEQLADPKQPSWHVGGIDMATYNDRYEGASVSRFFNIGQLTRLFHTSIDNILLQYEPAENTEDREDLLLIFKVRKADAQSEGKRSQL